MFYRELDPGQLLEPFIHCLWMLENDRTTPSIERILPDGRPEIVIHYRDAFEKWSPQQAIWQRQAHTLFIGQARQCVVLRTGLRSGIIGARFRPSGAQAFLGLAMSETTNQIIELNQLPVPGAGELEERICVARTSNERMNALKQFLESRLMTARRDSFLQHIIRFITSRNGSVELREISQTFQISERQLERKFRNGVGLSPKYFARIVRFQSALKAAQDTPQRDLTDLAMEFGYFDQSHFIKDFKQFSGLAPSIYFEEPHSISDQFTSQY